MTFSHGFRQLANVLENLEANGLEVLDVATTDDEPSERLTVDLTVTVPIDVNASPDRSTRSDETVEVRDRVLDPLSVRTDATNGATAIKTPDEESTDEAEPTSDAEDAGPVPDADAVDCPIADCDATFESDHGMKIHRTKVHGHANDGTDDGAPAYHDPDRLREVYATCNSFTEMREALETDVSAQTIRRQMIAHDIYEPGESGSGSKATEDDGDSGSKHTTADGTADEVANDQVDNEIANDEGSNGDDESELETVELPEGVTVADLKSAVSSAQTLYDVQQRFDLDRNEAMQLLERYDLLDIVHGRISNRDLRKQVDEDEITRRILEHAPVTQPSRA